MAKNAKTAPSTKGKPTMAQANVVTAYVNPKALSVDVGMKAVKAFLQTKNTDDKINELMHQNTMQKGQTLAMLTEAFHNAAVNDKSIKLENIRFDVKEDLSALRQKLEVAVGIKIEAKNEDGTQKLAYAPWTKEYFPQPGEDKKTGVGQKKENFRSNFAAIFTKSIRAALAIKDKGMSMRKDEATGVLLLSGKAVKEHFNVDEIALNEKREVKDGDKVVKLAKIPSYTELARIALEGTGKELKTRVDSRAKVVNAANEDDVLTAVKSIRMTISKLTKFGDELANELEELQSDIDKALDANREQDNAA